VPSSSGCSRSVVAIGVLAGASALLPMLSKV